MWALALTASTRFVKVELSEPPVGPRVGSSALCPDGIYMIRASWADSERHRWDTLKVASQAAYEWEAPLTYEE